MRIKGVKLSIRLRHAEHLKLQEYLEANFPAHKFAIHYFWNTRIYGPRTVVVTTITVYRDNELYKKLYPEIKELTLEDIAQLAGVPVSCLRIKNK